MGPSEGVRPSDAMLTWIHTQQQEVTASLLSMKAPSSGAKGTADSVDMSKRAADLETQTNTVLDKLSAGNLPVLSGSDAESLAAAIKTALTAELELPARATGYQPPPQAQPMPEQSQDAAGTVRSQTPQAPMPQTPNTQQPAQSPQSPQSPRPQQPDAAPQPAPTYQIRPELTGQLRTAANIQLSLPAELALLASPPQGAAQQPPPPQNPPAAQTQSQTRPAAPLRNSAAPPAGQTPPTPTPAEPPQLEGQVALLLRNTVAAELLELTRRPAEAKSPALPPEAPKSSTPQSSTPGNQSQAPGSEIHSQVKTQSAAVPMRMTSAPENVDKARDPAGLKTAALPPQAPAPSTPETHRPHNDARPALPTLQPPLQAPHTAHTPHPALVRDTHSDIALMARSLAVLQPASSAPEMPQSAPAARGAEYGPSMLVAGGWFGVKLQDHSSFARLEIQKEQPAYGGAQQASAVFTLALDVMTADVGLVRVRLSVAGSELVGTFAFESSPWADEARRQLPELEQALTAIGVRSSALRAVNAEEIEARND